MTRSWLPRLLHPDYSWPTPVARSIAVETPPVPHISSYLKRQAWGILNSGLSKFSVVYCRWMQVPFCTACQALPFGLVLKWTERTRIEEVLAMQMARSAGMPVPAVIGYGEHPDHFARISILMTRSPGINLGHYASDGGEELSYELEEPWMEELDRCLKAIRRWKSPFGDRICSVIGTNITTTRVPKRSMGPVENEKLLNEYLISPASSHFSITRRI